MSTSIIPRRRGLALGLLLVILGAVVVTWWLLAGNPTSDVSADEGEILAQEDSAASGGDNGTALDMAALEVTYDFFLARDPFESIRPPEPTQVVGEGDSTSNGGSSGGAATNGSPPAGSQPSDPCRTGTEAVCDGSVVVLRSVSGGQILVEVDGTAFSVGIGGTFATNFQVLAIEGDCVVFLYMDGDEADRFRLCVGDVVAK